MSAISIWQIIFFADIVDCDVSDGCHDNATCTDGDGSYTCACMDGFYGDGFSCKGMFQQPQLRLSGALCQ